MAPSAPPQSSAPSAAAAAAETAVTIVSKCNVYPDKPSTMGDLRLSVSDLPMLSCHYIQKGLFYPSPPIPIHPLLALLKRSLSRLLTIFPALAGRLSTRPDASIHISCNDAGVEFTHAVASHLSLPDLLPSSSDVPREVRSLFPLDGAVSYHGHSLPLAAFQLTELADGAVFLGCAVDHAVADGTSLWNLFNCWAELCRSGGEAVSRPPDFRRNYFGGSRAVLRFPGGAGPEVTFPVDAPLRERIFHFSPEAIRELKSMANQRSRTRTKTTNTTDDQDYEILGKQSNDPKAAAAMAEDDDDEGEAVISSFQSLCAQLWKSVTRARRQLADESATTFRMAVNCRHRVSPKVDACYFGNAIQSIPTTAGVGEVRRKGLRWAAGLLRRSVAAHVDEKVREVVAEWEAAPRCFPLGNPDGAGVTMGSSPRFPMYEGNDFGWGGPVAVRSGRANKFDGKISAFPGREGGGSVDLEVCLAPATMAALLQDGDFMYYVSEDHQPLPSSLV